MFLKLSPVENDQLLKFDADIFHDTHLVIPYSSIPDSVGIAVLENDLNRYRVYCTNEHGALDWEKLFQCPQQALDFAQKFYVSYRAFLDIPSVSPQDTKSVPQTDKISFPLEYNLESSYLDQYQVVGGNRLQGEISISGCRDSALGVISAALLINGVCCIENFPDITDIRMFLRVLTQIGVSVRGKGNTAFETDCTSVDTTSITGEPKYKLEAFSYLLGALLGRFGRVSIPVAFLNFPLDQHLKALNAMGATVDIQGGIVHACVPHGKRLAGCGVYLDSVSVGATVSTILAATLAKGETIIRNTSKDPSIVDLACFLNSAGGNVKGAGTDTIRIQGVEYLAGSTYSIIPDRLETGTYMMAVAAVGGCVLIQNAIPEQVKAISLKLQEMGVKIANLENAILVESNGKLHRTRTHLMSYPGFPEELQPQLAASMTFAEGASLITNSPITAPSDYMEELQHMGAAIAADRDDVVVEGIRRLHGNIVNARSPQAGAAIIIAALAAEGTTTINNPYFIERRYSSIVEKLSKAGADIKVIHHKDDIYKSIPKVV